MLEFKAGICYLWSIVEAAIISHFIIIVVTLLRKVNIYVFLDLEINYCAYN